MALGLSVSDGGGDEEENKNGGGDREGLEDLAKRLTKMADAISFTPGDLETDGEKGNFKGQLTSSLKFFSRTPCLFQPDALSLLRRFRGDTCGVVVERTWGQIERRGERTFPTTLSSVGCSSASVHQVSL